MTIATVRRMGGSLGIVIPKTEAEALKLHEGDQVEVSLRKAPSMAETFGLLKGKLGDWESLLKEIDAEEGD